jgi:hypothetical protein
VNDTEMLQCKQLLYRDLFFSKYHISFSAIVAETIKVIKFDTMAKWNQGMS